MWHLCICIPCIHTCRDKFQVYTVSKFIVYFGVCVCTCECICICLSLYACLSISHFPLSHSLSPPPTRIALVSVYILEYICVCVCSNIYIHAYMSVINKITSKKYLYNKIYTETISS